MRTIVAFIALIAFSAPALADDKEPAKPEQAAPPSDEEIQAQIEKQHKDFESQLSFKTGTVSLQGGKIELRLPEGYRYLGPADAEKVLVEWGNPKGSSTEGMILPKGSTLWDEGSLAVVVEFENEGHVSDDDAAKIDYNDLLKQMRDGAKEDNADRAKQGLETVELVGWAEPPRYDRSARKLYWAKELAFSKSEGHTLNYFVRVLGRESVLDLNLIAGMDQLPQAKEEMGRLLGFADFTKGNQYTDFNKGTDRTAEYGIAALVAGGIAAKAIGAKGFLAILFAAKKFIILGIAAVAAFFKRFWAKLTGRKQPESDPPTAV